MYSIQAIPGILDVVAIRKNKDGTTTCFTRDCILWNEFVAWNNAQQPKLEVKAIQASLVLHNESTLEKRLREIEFRLQQLESRPAGVP
jgi:hypothetical protein